MFVTGSALFRKSGLARQSELACKMCQTPLASPWPSTGKFNQWAHYNAGKNEEDESCLPPTTTTFLYNYLGTHVAARHCGPHVRNRFVHLRVEHANTSRNVPIKF